jgi:cytochrome c biogenesis protein CcmG, thiol:disulfide interchange protein DsbE
MARGRLFLAALVLCFLSWLSCNKDPGPQVGMPAPDFALPDLEGRVHGLADFRGRVVVLNFWATWCPPCIDEMPSLERLHQALGERGVAVIAVSVDERFSDVPAFVEKFHLTFPVLYDEGKKVSRKYQSFKYPETYILDRDGRLKSKVVGPRDWSAPTVIRDMVDLLKSEPEPAATSGEG